MRKVREGERCLRRDEDEEDEEDEEEEEEEDEGPGRVRVGFLWGDGRVGVGSRSSWVGGSITRGRVAEKVTRGEGFTGVGLSMTRGGEIDSPGRFFRFYGLGNRKSESGNRATWGGY